MKKTAPNMNSNHLSCNQFGRVGASNSESSGFWAETVAGFLLAKLLQKTNLVKLKLLHRAGEKNTDRFIEFVTQLTDNAYSLSHMGNFRELSLTGGGNNGVDF